MNTFIGLRPKLKAEFEDGHGSSKHWVLVTLSGHGLGRKHEEVHELWPALLPLSLGIVKSQRTGPLNSMSLLIRKKKNNLVKSSQSDKVAFKESDDSFKSAASNWCVIRKSLWSDKASEERLHPNAAIQFSDFITERIQRKRILARLWTFFMFSQGGKEGKGKTAGGEPRRAERHRGRNFQ